MSRLPSLTVILPTFNEASWLPATLQRIDQELKSAAWTDAEILVVNDGSTDETLEILGGLETNCRLRVVTQSNSGRFGARLRGLQESTSESVLLIDSRVHANEGSLRFLAEQLTAHPERRVWNGDVDIANSDSPPAAFWLVVTRLAWRKYFATRMLTSFDYSNFDLYPKGTTFFFAPRDVLLTGCRNLDTRFEDMSLANDDTLLIKPISERERIFISPDFRCTYFSRDTLKKFRKHSFHRGTVFVDAYLRSGSRYLAMMAWLVAVAVSGSALLVTWPLPTLAGLGACFVVSFPLLSRLGITPRESIGFYRALPHFVPTYSAGILRGVWLLVRSRRTRAR